MKKDKLNRYFIAHFLVFSFSFLSFCSFATQTNQKNGCSGFFAVNPSDGGDYVNYYQRIELDKAWDITKGDADVRIGIIDSGIDGSNTDFISNVNSYLSHDFYDSSRGAISNPYWHGPLVANRMAAIGENNYGTAGVIWDLDLVSLRIDNDSNHNEDFDALIAAIEYASNPSSYIPILNFSGGFYASDLTTSQIGELQDAIDNYDGLFVCAAGNEQLNIDDSNSYLYPASFALENIIVVGATKDDSDSFSEYTNYGQNSIDLYAPGTNGTSLAAPLVAGTAGLLLSANPSLSTQQIKTAILNNVDEIESMSELCVSGGRLNVYKAVKSIIPSLHNGTNYSFSEISYQKPHWYKMNLTNGIYTIQTISSLDTSGYLYLNIQGNPLTYSSSGGSGNNFLITYQISTTIVYYLKIVSNSANLSANYQISISNHPHSYNYCYVPNGPMNHLCMCECGDYTVSPHIFPIEYGFGPLQCAVCGYTIGGLLNYSELYSTGLGSYLDMYGNIYLSHYDYCNYKINNDYINLELECQSYE